MTLIEEHLVTSARHDLHQASRVLLASHVRPDGDAIGALLGLGLALRQAGKTVTMVLSDGVPSSFRHLPGSDLIKRHADGDYDYYITVDCSEITRVGATASRLPDLNIDHHITNTHFARINLVDVEAAATSELLARLFPDLGLSTPPEVAAALLTGIITDTLGFRTINVTPKTLRAAALLMEAGGDIAALYRPALLERTFEAARYWGCGLSKIQRLGLITWTALTLEDRRASHYPGRDDADLINVLSTIEGAHVWIIFVEQKTNLVKVSWRAQAGYDVAQIALSFGGGGHEAAAGAEITGSLEDVQNQVLQATQARLNLA